MFPSDHSGQGAPKKANITRGVLTAVDLRVGRIVAVDAVDGASVGLWRLTVDFGPVGVLMADVHLPGCSPADVVDHTVVAAVNLSPRHAGGLRRDFVLLVSSDSGGRAVLVGPDGASPPGTPVC